MEGVAEVASIGGFVKQYQVTVDPTKLRAYNLSIADVSMAIKKSNGEVGGRSIEMAEKEFILRVRGYIEATEDLKKVAVGVGANGVPILLRDVANVQLGPDMRRGIAEWNGEGETVGGIVVVRYGANAREVIQRVKQRLDQAMKGLPPDVTYTIAYDRTALIDRAVATLRTKACRRKHRRRAGLHRISVAFPQRAGGDHHSADRNSDLVHGHVPPGYQFQYHVARRHRHRHRRNGRRRDHHDRERAQAHRTGTRGKKPHWQIIRDASIEVGPTLFYSLLVITVSFIPVFRFASAGRPAVQAFGVHQDLFDGSGGAALHHARACPHGLSYSRSNSTRGRKPDQSFLHSDLSSRNRFRHSMALGGNQHCCGRRRVGLLSLESARHKLSAATAAPDLSRDRQIVSRIKTWAPSSCRRFTKAICSTCRQRFQEFPRRKRANFCNRPTRS